MKINYNFTLQLLIETAGYCSLLYFLTLQQTSYETLNEVFRGLPQYLQINAVTEP
jgi:hypothetical protein